MSEPDAKPGSVLTWTPLDEQFSAAKIRSSGDGYCAISTTGDVACWGEFGSAVSDLRSGTPMRLVGISHVTDLAIGHAELCTIGAANRTACYRYEPDERELHQLDTPAVELAAAVDFVCGRQADGGVECVNYDGAFQVQHLTGAKSLSCTGNTCCAAVADGSVACWGEADEALGYRSPTSIDVAVPIQETVPGTQSIVVRNLEACVRTIGGGAHCWGSGDMKRLDRARGVRAVVAIGTSSACVLGDDGVVTCVNDVPRLDHVVDTSDECAVHADGHVTCWGLNLFGRLGDGLPLAYPSPTRVPGLDGATSIAMSSLGVCAVAGAKTTCWGLAPREELPTLAGSRAVTDQTLCTFAPTAPVSCVIDGESRRVASPDVPAPPTGAKALAIERSLECAIDAHDHLECAGVDARWQAIATPAAVSAVAPVSRGFCAVLRDGRVGCVDVASDFELPDRAVFRLVAGIRDAVEIAGLDFPTCARTSTGDVACWIRADDGTPVAPPAPIPAIHGATQLAAAGSHACALVAGAVWCWGSSDDGVLGTGTIPPLRTGTLVHEPADTPVRAKASFVATQIAASSSATCALDDGGHVWCWGSDREGLIGQGRAMQTTNPVRVVGLGPR